MLMDQYSASALNPQEWVLLVLLLSANTAAFRPQWLQTGPQLWLWELIF
jgi:hypothetical protein